MVFTSLCNPFPQCVTNRILEKWQHETSEVIKDNATWSPGLSALGSQLPYQESIPAAPWRGTYGELRPPNNGLHQFASHELPALEEDMPASVKPSDDNSSWHITAISWEALSLNQSAMLLSNFWLTETEMFIVVLNTNFWSNLLHNNR